MQNSRQDIEAKEPTVAMTPKKLRAGGRPKKAESDRLDLIIKVYVTSDERTKIRAIQADKQDVRKKSLSEFIKETILSEALKRVGTKPTAKISAENDRVLIKIFQLMGQTNASLKGLMTLYNQSIKRINSLPESKKLLDEILKNDSIILEVSELLPRLKGTIDLLQKHLFSTDTAESKTSRS